MPQINHLERKRTITLQVTPPADMALQDAIDIIQNDVLGGLKQAGQLDGLQISIGGNADKLVETGKSLQWNLLLALLITYLLMAALFENFLYPFIILFTVPLAAAGGFIGLLLVNILSCPPGIRHPGHARFYHPDRNRGQQRHSYCPPITEQRAV